MLHGWVRSTTFIVFLTRPGWGARARDEYATVLMLARHVLLCSLQDPTENAEVDEFGV